MAAFDLWARPLGLLYWAASLRRAGFEIEWIDCTDRAHPLVRDETPRPKRFHTGKYRTEPCRIQPEPVLRVGRTLRRYGLGADMLDRALEGVDARGGAPGAVLVGSRMTYWYHGVCEVVQACRNRWPQAPVVLGGIYATLCSEHARATAAPDALLAGEALGDLPRWLHERFPRHADALAPIDADPETWAPPAFDLCHDPAALPLLTSRGCPQRCSYCAASLLAQGFRRRSVDGVLREIVDHHERLGTTDFVFYDDALLSDAEAFFGPLMQRVATEGPELRFHLPNGAHYGEIEDDLALLMREAGVRTLRLSLESSDAHRGRLWSRPPDLEAFHRATAALRRAGYGPDEVAVYILAGTPGQSFEEVCRSIEIARATGFSCQVNEYSPIPGTREWARAVELGGAELAREPLWQNNSLYYLRPEAMGEADMTRLKRLARDGR